MTGVGGFKDRKAGLAIVILAIIGAAVAGLSAFLHYYPGLSQSFAVCGGNHPVNCSSLDQWKYAAVFGIPLACYGVLMYLLMLVTAIVSWYAGGSYYIVGLMLIFPITVFSLLVDGVLGFTMIRLKTFCILCATTYAVNFLLFLTVTWGLWRRRIHQGESYRRIIDGFFYQYNSNADKKAVMSLYLLLIFFLSFSFLSVSYLKQSALVESKKQLLETLLTEPAENLVLPESRLTLGPRNAKVKIVVFTDFLCPSCFRFYQFEKDTYEKYGDKVFIAYYNYPLDQSCNPYIDHTAQRSSCTAARAVLAAADLNIFPEFIKKHYSEYEHISVYDKDVALDMAKGLTNPEQLVAKMNSQEVNQVLSRDIELAKGLGIKSTPTIFINGRRITGMPTQEIMETIIDKELGKFNH